MPIFTHVALDFDGELLTITANDGVRTYSESVPATGDPGKCTVEAQKLARAVAGMKSGPIEITEGQIKQGRSKLKLGSMPFNDFPQPDYEYAKSTTLMSGQLSEAIAIVAHAMPQKDVRPMLNGIHLTEGFAVATDGHRLAFWEIDYDGPDITIPADSVRQMPDMKGIVSVSDNQMIIDGNCARFSTSLQSGKYPDWRRVVQKEFGATATVNADDLLAALKTAQLGREIGRFEFTTDTLSVVNDNAEAACDLECDKEITTGFNYQYVIDAVMASGLPNVEIQINGMKSSLINGHFVLMPVKI
jgi:DNA polymerase III sliding clamp (beta) subunit (PCNA family)